MPRLERPLHRREPETERARVQRRPMFAKIELRDAWEAVQSVQKLRPPGLGLASDATPLLESLRARLPAFMQPRSVPDRSRLSSVESFFRYTEEEGKRFFEELDQDGDGRVKLDDLKKCMRRRKLPERYAHEFMRRAKRGWFNDSIGWEEFAALMHERESFTLRAYNSLQLNRSGHLVMPAITSSLRRLGLPATEENASAMLRYLGRAQDGYISYGEFRNFLLLLPPEQVRGTDPSVLWFEAATFVQLRAPAVAAGASGLALLKAALAGALASGSSTAVMHPLDTLKTRVQASVGRAPGLRGLARMIPELGARRLYLGIIPAVAGTATSHGIRTASYEWARVMLSPLLGLPGVSDTAIQGIASGFGTFLGTGVRIPNEVLKQRLQTGQHAHVLEAVRAVIRGGGIAGLFAGTTATLAREVPFYVLGMVAYERLKAVARSATGRELTSWQTIAVGALSGAAAAVATTPADVLKTRIMTGRAPAGLGALALAQRMIAEEGISSLYKGAAPRALWIAPLGAMNFAGYELAKKALSAAPDTEPELATPPPPPATVAATPPSSATAAAKTRSMDVAQTMGAAGAQAGQRLREAVSAIAGEKGSDLRRASEAAAASVVATASAAAPHIKTAAVKGAGMLQKQLSAAAAAAGAARAPSAAAPAAAASVLPVAPPAPPVDAPDAEHPAVPPVVDSRAEEVGAQDASASWGAQLSPRDSPSGSGSAFPTSALGLDEPADQPQNHPAMAPGVVASAALLGGSQEAVAAASHADKQHADTGSSEGANSGGTGAADE